GREVLALGLGVRLVALLADELVHIEREFGQPLDRVVARPPALGWRSVEDLDLAGRRNALRNLRDGLLLRIERLDQLLRVFDGAALLAEVEVLELHLVL